MGAFRRGEEGGRREGGVDRLIEGGGVGRPDRKNLQILDVHRLAPLKKACRYFNSLLTKYQLFRIYVPRKLT